MPQTVLLHLERTYRASAEELWSAWTDPARLRRWLGELSGPLSADRSSRMAMGDGDADWVDLTVLRADEPRLLELRWGFAGEPDTRLTVTLHPLDATTTRLELVHSGLPAEIENGYRVGWQVYLDQDLPALFSGARLGPWDERFAAAVEAAGEGSASP